jgi:hypothetical protein
MPKKRRSPNFRKQTGRNIHEKYKKLDQLPRNEELQEKLSEQLENPTVGKLNRLASKLTGIKPNRGNAADKFAGRVPGRFMKGKL